MPLPLDGISVTIAIPTTRDFPYQTVLSLIETIAACHTYGIPLYVCVVPSSLVHHSRSVAAHSFLKGNHTRLFWIDSDIVWKADDFIRVLVKSKRHDVICGVYPAKRADQSYFVRVIDGAEPDEFGLVPIEGTGLGFACVSRGVIEHLAALAPKLKFGGHDELIPHIFRCDDDGTDVRGEDYAFWADVREHGYTIMADTQVDLGHVGQQVYRSKCF
jgi:hypothetical protein